MGCTGSKSANPSANSSDNVARLNEIREKREKVKIALTEDSLPPPTLLNSQQILPLPTSVK